MDPKSKYKYLTVKTTLDEKAFDAFMLDMMPVQSKYYIKIEHGWINIIPKIARATDASGEDSRLVECMTKHQALLLAAVSSDGENLVGERRELEGTTFAWMIEHGALGKMKVPNERWVEQ